MIRAIVGAGGKTSLIKKYAGEFRKAGKSVFVTTSTRMYIEEETLLTDDPEKITAQLRADGYVMAGLEDGIKIKSLPLSVYTEVCRYADEVLVEADGSKHMPLKFPSQTEPVIYDNVEEIIVVAGSHGIGMKAKDAVQRLELVPEALGIGPETVIGEEHMIALVEKGYLEPLREKYPDKKISALIAREGEFEEYETGN